MAECALGIREDPLVLFVRRTAKRLSEVKSTLKIYLVQQPVPGFTVGEHQIALVGDLLDVSIPPLSDSVSIGRWICLLEQKNIISVNSQTAKP